MASAIAMLSLEANLQEGLNFFAAETNCCFATSLYLIAENTTVMITLAPCSDKSESNETWIITGPFKLFLIEINQI